MIKNIYFKDELIHNEYDNDNIIETLENIVMNVINNIEKEENFDGREALKAIQLINLFCEANSLEPLNISEMSINSGYNNFKYFLENYLEELLKNNIQSYNNPFLKQKSNLTVEERTTIQELLNKLRDTVESEENITDEHKRRILKKVNEMQAELNKKISDLDYLGGKIMSIVKGVKYIEKEIISPLVKDATELAKAVNRMESKESGVPDNIQIEYKYEETIETVEITEIPQIEDKSNK
jgi:hypothetical protein